MKRFLLLFALLSGLLAPAQQVILQNPGLSGAFQISSGTSADTTSPSASITSPTGGTVSGVVTVSVTATDNVGVTSVQLWVGGANSGLTPGVSGSTYTFSWNTTYLTNGSYSLQAIAFDAAANQGTSTAVTVTTSNLAGACGPPNYDCFNSTTNVINYSVPGPEWTSTPGHHCDWTSPVTVSNCGNLVGANVQQTPSDFGTTLIRCTDVNTSGNPANIWQTYSAPSLNAWNSDDTGILLNVQGGNQWLFRFDPVGLTCTPVTDNTGTRISFAGSTWFDSATNNVLYGFGTTNQTKLYQYTVNLSGGSAVGSTLLYDFNNSNCLANPINGVSGGFPQGSSYWAGSVGSSADDTTFSRSFSTGGTQETAVYIAIWTIGQSGCDVWNTTSGVITHNGSSLGNVSDADWGGTYGGKMDKFYIHDSTQFGNPNYVELVEANQSKMTYGTYNSQAYFWQKGTNSVIVCGKSAPNWKASNAYDGTGDRVSPASGNAGGYIYQIINGVGGTSSATPPTWNQTPGSDTPDGPLTWRNVGFPTASQYFCDGHSWKGYNTYANGKHMGTHLASNAGIPLVQLMPSTISPSAGDQHFSNANGDVLDSKPVFVMSADVGAATQMLNSSVPYPSAFYNEIWFMGAPNKPDGSANCAYDAVACPHGVGMVRRATHTWGSNWHPGFVTQNGMTVVSQTGNFAAISSDGMGQFGNTSGGASCNVGAPDWVKNATSDGVTSYSTGYTALPNVQTNISNKDSYLFTIQSCSGACKTGFTKPSWPQSNGATVADTTCDGQGQNCGTITWQNTGVQANCRAEIIIAKLTR